MERNLDRRVEAVVPVDDPVARARLADVVDAMLADDRHSWQLGYDSVWRRTEDILGRPGSVDAFSVLKRAALAGPTTATREPSNGSRPARPSGRGRKKKGHH